MKYLNLYHQETFEISNFLLFHAPVSSSYVALVFDFEYRKQFLLVMLYLILTATQKYYYLLLLLGSWVYEGSFV